jgi:formylmethanofuran dehydrogenase subunit E
VNCPVDVIEGAAGFHGHLGPFLVIGVRMGLIGLKQLGAKQNDDHVTVKASLPLRVPFSCIIDGLQVTTKCTVGNQKLSLANSEKIKVEFENKDDGRKIVVALNQAAFERLKSQLLRKSLQDEEIRKLAWKVAALTETELFATA